MRCSRARASRVCSQTPESRSWGRPRSRRAHARRSRPRRPDVAIIDIKMPPTHTDEGIVAAQRIRDRIPGRAVLVLSSVHRADLRDPPARGALGAGGLPAQRARLRHRRPRRRAEARHRGRDRGRPDDRVTASLPPPAAQSTRRAHEREREVLELVAEGRSNQAIAQEPFRDDQDGRGRTSSTSSRSSRSTPARTPTAACSPCWPSCVASDRRSVCRCLGDPNPRPHVRGTRRQRCRRVACLRESTDDRVVAAH